MITGYFRESEDGFFHDVQSTAAQALEPFEIAAERLSRPFTDAWGWFDGLRDAKAERDRMAVELDAARAQLQSAAAQPRAEGIGAAAKNAAAEQLAKDFDLLRTEVLFENPGFAREIVVSAGSNEGIRMYDPVVATGKSALLVGHVSKVSDSTARVTLITDTESAVAAYDLTTDAKGLVLGRGAGDSTLAFDRVPKQEVVSRGDYVLTSGRLAGEGLASFYPRRILIGSVLSVDQSDTDAFKLVTVQPFADLSDLDAVVVLMRKKPLPRLP
jgi:rod shape-determining protein MreC